MSTWRLHNFIIGLMESHLKDGHVGRHAAVKFYAELERHFKFYRHFRTVVILLTFSSLIQSVALWILLAKGR